VQSYYTMHGWRNFRLLKRLLKPWSSFSIDELADYLKTVCTCQRYCDTKYDMWLLRYISGNNEFRRAAKGRSWPVCRHWYCICFK